jgi:hypothetical protein
MQGNYVRGFQNLAALGVDHFSGLFKEPDQIKMDSILKQPALFPQLIANEENGELYREVSLEELRGVFSTFKKEKSIVPDGWTVEFFEFFFDLLGDDLLQVVEEVRTSGKLLPCINATFIVVTLKLAHPSIFNDFRPIALCNCLYKIIATRLKPILASSILAEQFGFLKGQLIHEAIGSTQEGIHSMLCGQD